MPEASSAPDWLAVISNLVSWSFLKIIGVLVLVLMIAGSLVWLFERRANPEQFSNRPLKGIADGLWWAAVTMTSVGYGDKAPQTRSGRILAGIWMFAAVAVCGHGYNALPHLQGSVLRDPCPSVSLCSFAYVGADHASTGGVPSDAERTESVGIVEAPPFLP